MKTETLLALLMISGADLATLPDEAFSSPRAQADTWVVPDDFVTIQEAIDFAASGDTILVRPGRYVECLLIAAKSLYIASLGGPAATAIEGWAPTRPDTLSAVLAVATDSFVLDGFTVSRAQGGSSLGYGSRSHAGGGIYLFTTGGMVRNCIIEENSSAVGGGIYAFLSPATVENCTVRRNEAAYNGGGLMIEQSMLSVRDCLVSNNLAPSGGGIACVDASPHFENLVVAENGPPQGTPGWGGGIYAFHATPEIAGCTIAANRARIGCGISLSGDFAATISRSIIAFNGGDGHGIACLGVLPQISCCDIYANGTSSTWCGEDAGGNLDADPLLCEDYSIADRSPCAPPHSPPSCGLIGALDVGCESAVMPATWGSLKARYRGQ